MIKLKKPFGTWPKNIILILIKARKNFLKKLMKRIKSCLRQMWERTMIWVVRVGQAIRNKIVNRIIDRIRNIRSKETHKAVITQTARTTKIISLSKQTTEAIRETKDGEIDKINNKFWIGCIKSKDAKHIKMQHRTERTILNTGKWTENQMSISASTLSTIAKNTRRWGGLFKKKSGEETKNTSNIDKRCMMIWLISWLRMLNKNWQKWLKAFWETPRGLRKWGIIWKVS